MRTTFVGLFPAKSRSAVVAHVGFINPVAGALVNETCAKPGKTLNIDLTEKCV